jgi:hypothetical protein
MSVFGWRLSLDVSNDTGDLHPTLPGTHSTLTVSYRVIAEPAYITPLSLEMKVKLDTFLQPNMVEKFLTMVAGSREIRCRLALFQDFCRLHAPSHPLYNKGYIVQSSFLLYC